MVDVKIAVLPSAAALTGNELIPAVQGGSTVKVPVSAIREGMASDNSVVHTTGDESIGGVKIFTGRPVLNIGTRLPVSQQLRFGDGVAADVGAITANSVGTAIVAGNAASGSGGLLLRPNNAASVTGQVALNADGSMIFGGLQAAKLATLSSLGAVNDSGSQSIAGNKTFSGASLFTGSITQRTGTIGGVEIQSPTGIPGIIGRSGDPADVNNQYRHDIHFGAGFVRMLASTAVGSTAPPGGWRMDAHFYPVQNNTMSCGTPSNLWTQVCATNGTINTSDERLKTPLVPMTDAEEAAFLEINELPMKWQWLARIAEEGDAARWHAGPSVQAAIAIMEKHELEAFSYGVFCYDAWPAQDEVWREWPAEAAEVIEWPAVPEQWADVPAELDDAGEIIVPARRELIQLAMPGGRVVLKEAVEAGRELVQPAIAAGDRYSFRISELHAWILAATARRDRREREAAELRLADIEQRLAVLESGK